MPTLARAVFLSCVLLCPPAFGDAVSDALSAATTAYAAGDLQTAAAQIAAANSQIASQQSTLMAAQFPPAPQGWIRTDNADIAQALAMIGGGAGAEASYADPDGMTITLSAYADNAMVQTFAGLLSGPQVMAAMGKTVQINGVTFLEQDETSTMALLENRVLLQASGPPEQVQALLGQMDLAAMARFDAN